MNKALKYILHIIGVLLALFIIIGIPFLIYGDLNLKEDNVEADSTIPLSDIPSGEYLVLMNTEKHEEYLDSWKEFFVNDAPVIIFEDIIVTVAKSDTLAIEYAKRCQSYLPENQMELKYENATLLVSKIETGYLDVAILSKEVADYLNLKTNLDNVTLFNVVSEETNV